MQEFQVGELAKPVGNLANQVVTHHGQVHQVGQLARIHHAMGCTMIGRDGQVFQVVCLRNGIGNHDCQSENLLQSRYVGYRPRKARI